MTAVLKRELKAYFTSPLGYVILALTFATSGYLFFSFNLSGGDPDLNGVFGMMLLVVVLLILPVLTMRLFSDEKRFKTDQALLTAPVSLTGIVMGKFLAAFLVFAFAISITLVYAVVIALMVAPDWMVIIGNFLGIFLLGALVIAIGIFISSLTESQLVAALGTIGVTFAMIMIDNLISIFSAAPWVIKVVDFLSITQRYNNFTAGLINYDDIVFFITFAALFLFLTVRNLDRKRWI